MKIKKLVVSMFAVGMMATPLAHATNGYFSHGYGMKAKGMGGAATAMAIDAMGGANNPASMVWVGDRLDVGVDWFSPINASRAPAAPYPWCRLFSPFCFFQPEGSEDSGNNNFLIPEFGYNQMIERHVVGRDGLWQRRNEHLIRQRRGNSVAIGHPDGAERDNKQFAVPQRGIGRQSGAVDHCPDYRLQA